MHALFGACFVSLSSEYETRKTMRKINPQKASLLATFSVALQLPEKIQKRIRTRNADCVHSSSSYMNGLFISDNCSGEAWAHKWDRGSVKIENYNTKFYIISYSYVRNIGSVDLPFFCN